MSRKNWLVLIGISVLVILIFGAGLWALLASRGFGPGLAMMRPRMMVGSPFMFMGGLGMLVFWALVIGGIVWLIQSATRRTNIVATNSTVSETPLDILKRRYAKGEITKEQFEEMKNTLA
jgi:putative membrane protein